MLGKLLKYDFKSVFKFWWIAALTSFVLSLIGGGCITVLRAERDLPTVVNASAMFVLIIAIVSVCVFCIVPTIIILIRYYKNFFTDEGYLTFTLPVKVKTLINSKLIMSVTLMLATAIVLALDVFTMLGIGFAQEIFSKEFLDRILFLVKELANHVGAYLVLYGVEAVLFVLLSVIGFYLFLFCCITLASVITKKARVVTAIAIYYGVNCIVTFVMEIFVIFGMREIIQRIGALSENMIYPVLGVGLLTVIALFTVFCIMLYTLLFYMTDRKLNLT